MRWLPRYLVFVTPALVVAGGAAGGGFTLLAAAFVFVLLPLLDAGLGVDLTHPGAHDEGERWAHDLPLLSWVPVQLGVTAWVLARIAGGAASGPETVGLLLSLGTSNGAGGITIAHELMHRRRRLERALAEVLMTSVSYPHFCVEHVLGHHRRVATPEDPATARVGESVYAFYLRCVASSLASAWRLEGQRAARDRIAPLSLRDRRLRHPLLLALAWGGAWAAWGPAGLVAFVAQGLVAFTLLEVVNYLEHYGLLRRELAPGRYERVRPEHSWNASQRVSNWYLFNLARHSDHHAFASLPYERLRHREEAPQLPAGYATMLLLALAPPLWFRVMDPRVAAWRARAGASAPVPNRSAAPPPAVDAPEVAT